MTKTNKGQFSNTLGPSGRDRTLAVGNMDRLALTKPVWMLFARPNLEGNGAQVTRSSETTGNHLRVDWGNGDEQILVLCHMDTVRSRGETSKRPFKVEGGKYYGPGAYMKSGIVQAMFAVKALDALN